MGMTSAWRRRPPEPPDPIELAERLQYEFTRPELLRRAMAHRSWVAETPGSMSNERLEFLGDAVLGWIVADLVYHRFADLPEGALTDLRKSVVSASALAAVAAELGLGEYLLLGRGEDAAGGRAKASILSDALEAVLGALYLDGGPGAVFPVVERLMGPRLVDAVDRLDELDHKSRLQELLARLGRGAPSYSVTSEGPDHAKRFFADVIVDGRVQGSGQGRSKKSAEQAAAAAAWTRLDGHLVP